MSSETHRPVRRRPVTLGGPSWRPGPGRAERLGWMALGALALLAALSPPRRASAESPEENLLRRSDVATAAPNAFRVVLRVTAGGKATDLEVWRSSESRTLVRFLDQKERGKYLVRLDGDLWFLSPGAKRPVRLAPTYRLKGSASLDDLLGIHYSRDYEIVSVSEGKDDAGSLAVFDLRAMGKAPYPRVRYMVRSADARPVRAEYTLTSGKLASVVEFVEWDKAQRMRFKRLIFRDALRGGAVTEVELLEMEERSVPPGLFDLQDRAERARVFGATPKVASPALPTSVP